MKQVSDKLFIAPQLTAEDIRRPSRKALQRSSTTGPMARKPGSRAHPRTAGRGKRQGSATRTFPSCLDRSPGARWRISKTPSRRRTVLCWPIARPACARPRFTRSAKCWTGGWKRTRSCRSASASVSTSPAQSNGWTPTAANRSRDTKIHGTSVMSNEPIVKGFFDKRTFSVQYVVSDPATKQMRHRRPGPRFRREVRRDGNDQCRRDPRLYQ